MTIRISNRELWMRKRTLLRVSGPQRDLEGTLLHGKGTEFGWPQGSSLLRRSTYIFRINLINLIIFSIFILANMTKHKKNNRIIAKFPFTYKDKSTIICNDSELKQINSRRYRCDYVVQYYKCPNKHIENEDKNTTCPFSGKLKFKIGTKPKLLLVLKNHSLSCHNKIKYIHKSSKKLQFNSLNFILDHKLTYEIERSEQVNISVQIHKS